MTDVVPSGAAPAISRGLVERRDTHRTGMGFYTLWGLGSLLVIRSGVMRLRYSPTCILKLGMQEAQWSAIVVLSFDYSGSSFLGGYNYRGQMKA